MVDVLIKSHGAWLVSPAGGHEGLAFAVSQSSWFS